jgi:hypothetical protein
MHKPFGILRWLACGALLLNSARAAEGSGLDSDGFIRDWLMLAPISLPEGAPAGDLLLRDQVRGEAALKPKAGDTLEVGARELTWRRITAVTNHVDFNAILQAQNDRAAGFLVTYVECDEERRDVTMAVGSNDQGRIYFNGVDIYAFTEARPLMLDADKGRVTLKKGLNVIVFKVINEQNSWQAALRLLDKTGVPLGNVRIRMAP